MVNEQIPDALTEFYADRRYSETSKLRLNILIEGLEQAIPGVRQVIQRLVHEDNIRVSGSDNMRYAFKKPSDDEKGDGINIDSRISARANFKEGGWTMPGNPCVGGMDEYIEGSTDQFELSLKNVGTITFSVERERSDGDRIGSSLDKRIVIKLSTTEDDEVWQTRTYSYPRSDRGAAYIEDIEDFSGIFNTIKTLLTEVKIEKAKKLIAKIRSDLGLKNLEVDETEKPGAE